MSEFVKRIKALGRTFVDLRLVLGVIGLLLSVVLHELFHILMHWGEVTHIQLFANAGAIAEVAARMPHGYDLEGEEIAAYAITLLTLILTAIMASAIHDKRDSRSFSETLAGKHQDFELLDPSEIVNAATRLDLLSTRF